MKKGIAKFVAKGPSYKQVKAKHQRLSGLTQDIEIPTWKLEEINIDFMVGFPRTRRNFDSILVIVDRIIKSTHFLPIKTAYSAEDYAKVYIWELVRLHGVPLSITLDRDIQFTSHFWRTFQKGSGTKMELSTVPSSN